MFVPIKTPIDQTYDIVVPVEKRFHLETFLDLPESRDVGIVIDLTNSVRYYDTKPLLGNRCYSNIRCDGDNNAPTVEQVDLFIDLAFSFFELNQDAFIGVHCIHGFNCTGFMIISYLCERCEIPLGVAVHIFANARPPGIYKQNFLDELIRRYDFGAVLVAPPEPSWSAGSIQGQTEADYPEVFKEKKVDTVKDIKIRFKPVNRQFSKKKGLLGNVAKELSREFQVETHPVIEDPQFQGEQQMIQDELEDNILQSNPTFGEEVPMISKALYKIESKSGSIQGQTEADYPEVFKEKKVDTVKDIKMRFKPVNRQFSKKKVLLGNVAKELSREFQVETHPVIEDPQFQGEQQMIHEELEENILPSNPTFVEEVPMISKVLYKIESKSGSIQGQTEADYPEVFKEKKVDTVKDIKMRFKPVNRQFSKKKVLLGNVAKELSREFQVETHPVIEDPQFQGEQQMIHDELEENILPSNPTFLEEVPMISKATNVNDIKSVEETTQLVEVVKKFHDERATIQGISPNKCNIQNTNTLQINHKSINKGPGITVIYNNDRYAIRDKISHLMGLAKNRFPGNRKILNHDRLHWLNQRSYRVTWNSGGSHYLMFIAARNEVFLLDPYDRVYKVNYINFPINDFKDHYNTIIDGEMVLDVYEDETIYRYLIFDIMVLDGEYVGDQPFRNRTELIDSIILARNKYLTLDHRMQESFAVQLKSFWPIDNVKELWDGNFRKTLGHQMEGLTFQPTEVKDFCGTGLENFILEWKPSTTNSIDFLLKVKTTTHKG